MIDTLVAKTCTPCRGGIPPLTPQEAEHFHVHVPQEAGRGLDVGWHGRRRSIGYGRERAAQTTGVLGLVLGIKPGEHRAGALVDEVDETEIPAGVAHFEPRQMAVPVGSLGAKSLK